MGLTTSAEISAQSISPDNEFKVSSIKDLYNVTDTIRGDRTHLILRIVWMGASIEVRVTERVQYDLEQTRKFRRDSTFIATRADSLSYLKIAENFTQNCHSYSLEKYFDYHGISGNLLFNKSTVLIENKYMNVILDAAFKKIKSILTKPSKNLKTKFESGSLLVFRNKYGWPIHSLFVDDVYYTKNGGTKAFTVDQLEPIFKVYWDTKTIEEYQIDASKVKE